MAKAAPGESARLAILMRVLPLGPSPCPADTWLWQHEHVADNAAAGRLWDHTGVCKRNEGVEAAVEADKKAARQHAHHNNIWGGEKRERERERAKEKEIGRRGELRGKRRGLQQQSASGATHAPEGSALLAGAARKLPVPWPARRATGCCCQDTRSCEVAWQLDAVPLGAQGAAVETGLQSVMRWYVPLYWKSMGSLTQLKGGEEVH